jgi:Uma2 family endonuclease
MASVALAPPPQAPPVAPALYRFTVEQYHRMGELGVLTENDRVELLEGWVVRKVTHNPPHAVALWQVQTALLARLAADWALRIQSPITLSDSEPEPDAVLARGPGSRYGAGHPVPRDIGLLVEVADASLDEDRGIKRRVYARARIAEYWIVNIPESQVEVYTQPRAGRSPAYRQQRVYRGDEAVPLVIDGQEIARLPARDLLPPGQP